MFFGLYRKNFSVDSRPTVQQSTTRYCSNIRQYQPNKSKTFKFSLTFKKQQFTASNFKEQKSVEQAGSMSGAQGELTSKR